MRWGPEGLAAGSGCRRTTVTTPVVREECAVLKIAFGNALDRGWLKKGLAAS